MPEPILLRPRRSFYIAAVGHFKKATTVIRADDPWFDKGGPLEGAREDFEPLRANTGGQIYGGPEPINGDPNASTTPARPGPGKPKGAAPAAKPKGAAAA